MNSLYNNIQVGDTISFPNSIALVKEGVVSSIVGLNGHAKVVKCLNGHEFVVSKYKSNYTLWCD